MAGQYPLQEEIIKADPLLEWIDKHFLRSDPFAFQGADFWPLIALISEELEIDANGIYCIGSGAVGLSLNPSKIQDSTMKVFDTDSDIDLAFISEVHFETSWRDLRRASQPTMQTIDPVVKEHLNYQRKRFFDGAIITTHLLHALSFGPKWVTSQVKIGELIARTLGREVSINFWIYRDYWSLRNYVARGVLSCREKLV